MMPRILPALGVLFLATILSGPLPRPAQSETFAGSNIDSQYVIGLRFDPDALQPWLPEGWHPAEFPGGPLAGANTLMVFVDRYLLRDAEGNPAEPATLRGLALASLARRSGSEETRTYVTRLYVTADGYDPYGNAVLAQITRRAGLDSSGTAPPARHEDWSVTVQGGGELRFSLSYQGGLPNWSAGELLPYSNTTPDFHRIYRFERLVDLAMSVPLDKSLAGEMSLDSDLAELAPLFDGSEQIVAVVAVPLYVRQLFLP